MPSTKELLLGRGQWTKHSLYNSTRTGSRVSSQIFKDNLNLRENVQSGGLLTAYVITCFSNLLREDEVNTVNGKDPCFLKFKYIRYSWYIFRSSIVPSMPARWCCPSLASPLFLLLLCFFSFSSFSCFSISLRTLSFSPYLPFNSPPPFLLSLSAFHLFLPLSLDFKFPFISTYPLPPLKVSLYQLSWPLLTLPFSFNTLDLVFLMMEITTYAHGAGEINIWWPPH